MKYFSSVMKYQETYNTTKLLERVAGKADAHSSKILHFATLEQLLDLVTLRSTFPFRDVASCNLAQLQRQGTQEP